MHRWIEWGGERECACVHASAREYAGACVCVLVGCDWLVGCTHLDTSQFSICLPSISLPRTDRFAACLVGVALTTNDDLIDKLICSTIALYLSLSWFEFFFSLSSFSLSSSLSLRAACLPVNSGVRVTVVDLHASEDVPWSLDWSGRLVVLSVQTCVCVHHSRLQIDSCPECNRICTFANCFSPFVNLTLALGNQSSDARLVVLVVITLSLPLSLSMWIVPLKQIDCLPSMPVRINLEQIAKLALSVCVWR